MFRTLHAANLLQYSTVGLTTICRVVFQLTRNDVHYLSEVCREDEIFYASVCY